MHKASADYYQSQADLLDAYLNNEADANKTEAQMAENLANYQQKLVEAAAQDDAKAKNLMMTNLTAATNDAQQKTQNIYEY